MIPRTFVLTVDRPIKRFDDTAAHLDSLGIPWERFNGLDNQKCRLLPVDTFDIDRAGERIGSKHIAACLTHYLLWKCMEMQPDESFIVLEYDARVPADFAERLEQIRADLPDDWQLCFLGSCCTEGRPKTHIRGDVYDVRYPLCGHGILYNRTALPILLRECQKIWAPLDIALFTNVLPLLKTYAVLPALVSQAGTPLPP